MSMQPDTEFPTVIDSTMRAAFVACPRKFFRAHVQHIVLTGESVDLLAGKAFAKGMEAARLSYWQDKEEPKIALGRGATALIKEWGDFEAPEDHVKQLDAMLAALAEYFSVYGFATDHIKPYMRDGTKPAVEFTFALPIPGTTHPKSGEPIIYAGRFDMLGFLHEKVLFVVDEKTTKQLGQNWSKQWELRSQFTGYCWAAQQFGYPVAGAIIRGVSILRKSFGHAEVIVYRPEWQIARWLTQLQRDIARMIDCWKTTYWDYNLDASCSAYFGCPYLQLCLSQQPETWFDNGYEKHEWDPLEQQGAQLTPQLNDN